ncbi:hypothetical protein M5689_017095 [Euphorbia peplus]|nr:hypothetical protein M5689_017095 [Euphorbia peplus]
MFFDEGSIIGLELEKTSKFGIPTSNSKKPLLCLANPKPLLVVELIDPLIKDWHRPTLHRCFMPSDVNEILKLKISYRFPPDNIYWGMTRSGVFSVKSCYFLTEIARFAGKQVPLPPKIKHFCWKLLKGILSTASLLFRRGTGSNCCCRYCGNPEENDLHTLFFCRGAVEVWKNAKLGSRHNKLATRSLLDWFEYGLKNLSTCYCCFVVALVRRNKPIHDNIWIDSSVVLEKEEMYISDFNKNFGSHFSTLSVSNPMLEIENLRRS